MSSSGKHVREGMAVRAQSMPNCAIVLGASVDGDAVDYIAAILDDEPFPTVEDLAECVITLRETQADDSTTHLNSEIPSSYYTNCAPLPYLIIIGCCFNCCCCCCVVFLSRVHLMRE